MASTVSTLKSLTDYYLGATYAYGSSDKLNALNAARKHILMNYYVDEFVIEDTVTFSSGKGTIPSTYLRWVKMLDPDDATTEYKRVDINEFDKDISNTFTIKADSSDSDTRKFYIYPTSVTSVTLRYIELPADLASDSDTIGFNTYWDDAFAAWAAWWILFVDRQDNHAEKLEIAKELSETALRHQDTELQSNEAVATVYDDDVEFFDEAY